MCVMSPDIMTRLRQLMAEDLASWQRDVAAYRVTLTDPGSVEKRYWTALALQECVEGELAAAAALAEFESWAAFGGRA